MQWSAIHSCMDNPDWTLYRSFLAVAEAGSLSAAARALRLSQPTLGRHMAELEHALGTVLFTRLPRGLTLTEAGAALLPAARQMLRLQRHLPLSPQAGPRRCRARSA